MQLPKLGLALLVAGAFLMMSGLARADDIPGTVIVVDENAAGDGVLYTAPARAGSLGQDENAFIADMQDGDAEAMAVAVDVQPNAVVATVLKIHQPTSTKHKGKKGNLKQTSHVEVTFLVYDNLVSLNLLGDGEALAPECKGQGTVTDSNADGIQDGAKWGFRCKEGAFDAAIADISGSDPTTAQAAAQAAVSAGNVKVSGQTPSSPATVTGVLDQVLSDL